MKHSRPELLQQIFDAPLGDDVDKIGLNRLINQIRKRYKTEQLETLKSIVHANKQSLILANEQTRKLFTKIVVLEDMIRKGELEILRTQVRRKRK